ncbi:AraC family transcriptional regulator [Microbacterium sp. CFBP9034]|uniref:AraC family transcriptional regulator n=1 Tax=Microbacterium sp. CFBP9034 TaxID=3096540 RepID=UPI002A6B8E45|nr:AraC family transcriptional regulator [Microbacterium sp. CFBP9034]MDY0909203.1 AraC family transcriptional regulator [Microbacterium sp. CFBP9034]
MATPMPWGNEDPLTDALYQLRMRGAFYSWTEAAGTAAVAMPQFADTLSFHIVARGTAYLEVDGEQPHRLDAGTLALVPRGIGHRVATAPGARVLGRADLLPQTMLGDAFSILRLGPEDEEAALAMLCGVVAFDSPAVHDMLAVLPAVIRVDSARHPVMAALVPLLIDELRDPRPGGEAVATRLADVLVVETVRAWLSDEPDSAVGWLAALRDPQLGAAIAAIHRDPGHPWTLAELARRAAMSRSGFAARFTAVVGTPAMSYVTASRMRTAHSMLAQGRSVAAVAAAHGYGSEAAFSRAFARTTGTTPGRVRRPVAA